MTAAEKYEQLLRELHTIIRAGGIGSPAADAVRDQMDEPWDAMSDEEHERAAMLSERLFAEAATATVKPGGLP
jgi:Spy/CpxP family protein refolding chaperone